MENKIAISSLAVLLSQSTGKSKKLCEDFLKEYFRVIAESLEQGETLKIKGFGTFKVVTVEARTSVNVTTGEKQDLAPYKKVVFTPSKDLAAEINAPFTEFESIEMEDEMPDDLLEEDETEINVEVDSEREQEKPAIVKEEDSQVIPDIREENHIQLHQKDNSSIGQEDILSTGQEVAEDNKLSNENDLSSYILEAGSEEEGEDDEITYEAYSPSETETQTVTQVPLPVYEEEEPQNSRFWMGFLIGGLSTFCVCAVIFMLGCFFDWWPVNFGNPVKTEISENQITVPEEQTSGEEINEVIPEEPVYDTVSTTRYLTTIAREHYGNFNFWPYIYLENQSILGHPDRITPGTRVVVPPLSKYGVNPENPKDEEEAKKKSLEIYSRYK